ncbi:GH12391 [Drosophila grimshawi]|uniref:GH12391 n=1 Tax=Drosophila grimshawi TaxID=7222 RepID=B4JIU9_DROGR|nr:GH12391 [Drosophila grimshawi]
MLGITRGISGFDAALQTKVEVHDNSGTPSVSAGVPAVEEPIAACSASNALPLKQKGTPIEKMKAISKELIECVLSECMTGSLVGSMLGYATQYEELLFSLIAENERLKERLKAVRFNANNDHAVHVTDASTRPRETWTLVVRSNTAGKTAKDVVEKVVKEVGPTLGVRVHKVKPLRDGGAIIRTPSVAERKKIAGNAKFSEVGLEVSVKERLGLKVVVQGVHSVISPDEFMAELYELNFKDKMSKEAFTKGVRIASKPWSKEGSAAVNVVLEGAGLAMQMVLISCEEL